MVRPVRARVRDIADDGSSCINVSGLSRVDCCCSQAMMRSAHAVPNKWFGHEARFFAQGLRHADPLFRHHYSRALQSSRSVRRMQDPCVRRALPAWSGQPRQCAPSWRRVRQQLCSGASGSVTHQASFPGDPGFDPGDGSMIARHERAACERSGSRAC